MMRAARASTCASLGIAVDPAAPMGSLPLGLQQLVELGRVLFSGARIIILDEPTSALSPPEVERLFAVLRRLRDGRAQRHLHLALPRRRARDLRPRHGVPQRAQGGDDARSARSTRAGLIERMIGAGHGELEESYTGATHPLDSRPDAPVVLRDRGADARRRVPRRRRSAVRAGEVLGLYGFMGSGQLELARALFGKLPADRGTHARCDGTARLHLARTAGRGAPASPSCRRAGAACCSRRSRCSRT